MKKIIRRLFLSIFVFIAFCNGLLVSCTDINSSLSEINSVSSTNKYSSKEITEVYEGFKCVANAEDLVEESNTNKVLKLTAFTSDESESVEVNFEVKNLYRKFSAVFFKRGIEGDTITISVPDDYVIKSLEIESYGTYDNFFFHNGQDTSGEKIDKQYIVDNEENRLYYILKPNCQHVTIDNALSYSASIYNISVYIEKN